MLDEDFICSYHRNNLDVFWRNSFKCSHPDHIKRKKINTKPATPLQIEKLSLAFSEKRFPIGSQLCMVHIKNVNKISSNFEEANTSIVSEFNLGNEFENEALSFEDLEESNKVQNELKNALDVELWRVKRKDLDELCNNSI